MTKDDIITTAFNRYDSKFTYQNKKTDDIARYQKEYDDLKKRKDVADNKLTELFESYNEEVKNGGDLSKKAIKIREKIIILSKEYVECTKRSDSLHTTLANERSHLNNSLNTMKDEKYKLIYKLGETRP